MLRISSPTDPTAKMFMRQTNTLSRQFWMVADSSSLKEITTAQITLTYPCISTNLSIIKTIFTNKTAHNHKSLFLTITNKHNNSEPDITSENVEKSLNTFILRSPHNTSVSEKTTKLLTPHLMTFIH